MENTEPRVFEDVKVFAGDGYPAADAIYKNLVWETEFCERYEPWITTTYK